MQTLTEGFIRAAQVSYAICLATNGILQLYYSDFRLEILPPWPSWLPGLSLFAWVAGVALILSAIAIVIRNRARTITLLVGGVLLLFIVLFHVPYMLFVSGESRHLGSWAYTLNTVALTGCAFVVAGSLPEDNANTAARPRLTLALERLIPFGRYFYCTTIIAFGICHFLYPKYIATLVPPWIPCHRFWTYFAGTCLIASGAAIVLKIKVRIIGALLGTMILSWVIVLHIPRAIADPYREEGNEIESAARALAESGTAFLLAFAARSRETAEDAF
jgi:uncharacterized membrane protein